MHTKQIRSQTHYHTMPNQNIRRNISLKLVDPPIDEFRETMQAFANSCQFLSKKIQNGDPLSLKILNRLYYRHLRNEFGLLSQMAQSAIRAALGAHRAKNANHHTGNRPSFTKPHLQLHYNRDWSLQGNLVSIRTLTARRRISFVTGEFQRDYLDDKTWKPEGAELVDRRGTFFLNVTMVRIKPPLIQPRTPIGIDLGVRSLAVARAPDAKPLIIRGGYIKDLREKHVRLRKRLKSKNTRSSRRVHAKLAQQEKRAVTDYCRKAARRIFDYALQFDSPILVFEDLTGIRDSIGRTSKKLNQQIHTWPFRVLRESIEMRAELLGIQVTFVDPSYTSQTCPRCKTIDNKNRQRDMFLCVSCKYKNNSDVVAATNIALRWSSAENHTGSGVQSITHTSDTESLRDAQVTDKSEIVDPRRLFFYIVKE